MEPDAVKMDVGGLKTRTIHYNPQGYSVIGPDSLYQFNTELPLSFVFVPHSSVTFFFLKTSLATFRICFTEESSRNSCWFLCDTFYARSSLLTSLHFAWIVSGCKTWVAQLAKNLPAIRETWVRSLGWEDPLEKGKATHSSILAWRIQSMGLQRVEHDWETFTFFSFTKHEQINRNLFQLFFSYIKVILPLY